MWHDFSLLSRGLQYKLFDKWNICQVRKKEVPNLHFSELTCGRCDEINEYSWNLHEIYKHFHISMFFTLQVLVTCAEIFFQRHLWVIVVIIQIITRYNVICYEFLMIQSLGFVVHNPGSIPDTYAPGENIHVLFPGTVSREWTWSLCNK